MKKTALLVAFLVGFAVPAFATPVCTTVTLNTLLAGGVNAAGCEVSDKIFSGFTYTGNIAAANINVTFQSNGVIPAGASILFAPNNGGFWDALNLQWTTSVDTSLCPGCTLQAVLDQITTTSAAATFTHTPGGSVTLTFSPFHLSDQLSLSGTSVTTGVVQSGGFMTGLRSSYSEVQAVPEPASLLLLGTGMGAIAARLRRRT